MTEGLSTNHLSTEPAASGGALALVPELRPLELHRQTHNGEPYVLLRDPLELSEQALMLPESVAAVLVFFDGTRTPEQIAQAYAHQFGVSLSPDIVTEIVTALDDCLLLETPRARAAIATIQAETAHQPRAMTIADAGYPRTPEALGPFLDGFLPESPSPSLGAEAVGLLSPHIDYGRGGPVYGQVWQAAAQAVQEADAVVMFATDHYGHDAFTLTRRPYATPYGVLPNDAELHAALVDALGAEHAFAGELRHQREHSVELVSVWLHHMRGGKPCPLVPILCGAPYEQIRHGGSPADLPHVGAVLETLAEQMQRRRIVVVASGDLAHVGPAFRGRPLDRAARAHLRWADEKLLGHMAAGDAEAFFAAIHAVQDRNNVCGVMPIYLTLKLLDQVHGPIQGQVTGYATCPADARDTSAVTIAGMVFGPGERRKGATGATNGAIRNSDDELWA